MRIKNWDEMQHYKDRDPTWVKLYPRIINSRAWRRSNDKQRLDMFATILYAVVENTSGEIPNDPDDIKDLTRIDRRPDLQHLFDVGFLIGDIDPDPGKEKEAEKEKERAKASALVNPASKPLANDTANSTDSVPLTQ